MLSRNRHFHRLLRISIDGWSRWRKIMFQWLRRITGFSTPLGGLSWSPSKDGHDIVPTFAGEIFLTSEGNDEFISFLDKNTKRIVFLNAIIDASVTIQSQVDFVKSENIDLDYLASGKFSREVYFLQKNLGKLAYVAFYFLENHVLNSSFGGTGIIQVSINGFFEVSPSFHGGPSTVFYLKEIEASLEKTIRATK